MSRPERPPARAVLLAGLVALGVGAGAALWSAGSVARPVAWAAVFLRGYFLAWFCYLAAALVVSRSARRPRWVLVWIVAVAVLLRVVALARTPPLSTDFWRYLWDGRVANASINPFRYTPQASNLEHLRDGNWQWISFRDIRTIYPPFAQIVFAGLARIRSEDAQAFRWGFALCDITSVFLLIALLRRTGHPPERVIWYAWCPLPIVEFTGGAHVDSVGICLLLLSLWLAARGQGKPGAASAAALAAAMMTKGFAFFALPFFVRRGGWRFAAWFAGVCLLLAAPFLSAGPRLFDGLSAYLQAWKANASLFALADWLLTPVTPLHYQLTRIGSIVAILLVLTWLVVRQRPGMSGLLAAVFLALGAQLLLSAPTLPWYVAWTVPALCWWAIPGWVLFTLTVVAQYYVRWFAPGLEYQPLWMGYLPVYALLAGQAWWVWRRGHRSATSHRA